jgi:hypothetical protein
LGKESVIAGVASLVEAIGLWLIITYAHGTPAIIIICLLIMPGLIVGLIYKIGHLEDWSHYEIICLLFFQLIVSLIGAGLLTGHFAMAITTAVIFVGVLAIIAGFMRGL